MRRRSCDLDLLTRDELLEALSSLPALQFERVLLKLSLPSGSVAGSESSPAKRAEELVGYLEAENRLSELEPLLRPTPPAASGSKPRAPSGPQPQLQRLSSQPDGPGSSPGAIVTGREGSKPGCRTR